MSDFSERFKQLRACLNMNQQTFASHIDISQAHISKIEGGKDVPSDKLLKQISQTFMVSFTWLKSGEGSIWERDDDLENTLDNTNLFKDIRILVAGLNLHEKKDVSDILISLKHLLSVKYKTPSQKSLAIRSVRDIFCYTNLFLIEGCNNSKNIKNFKNLLAFSGKYDIIVNALQMRV